MTTSEGVQVKRKQSSLAKTATENTSSSSLPTSLTKRPRSDSVDSRTSSWFQRLYPSNASATNLTNGNAPANDDTVTMTESQNDNNQNKDMHNTSTPVATGNGDDDDDNNSTKSSQQQQPSSGIWSWFGYSNASAESKLQDVSSSSSSPKEDNKQSTDIEQVKQEPVPVKSTSWRSFFWSSSDQRDSVVVEKNGTEGEASSSPSSTPSSPGTKPTSRPIKKNRVLPPVHATDEEIQSHQNDDNASSSSLVNKALRAINAMFSQYPSSSSSSHSRVNARFAKFVQSMQSHPEDIAGKKFVIIGVHGWFPTKVNDSTILYDAMFC